MTIPSGRTHPAAFAKCRRFRPRRRESRAIALAPVNSLTPVPYEAATAQSWSFPPHSESTDASMGYRSSSNIAAWAGSGAAVPARAKRVISGQLWTRAL